MKQVPGPHTVVKCAHTIHWANQALGKPYYVPSVFLGWVGLMQTGLRSGPRMEGLNVKSGQDC